MKGKTKQVLFKPDEMILKAFREVCDANKEKYSRVIEYLMREYLIFRGQEAIKRIDFNKYLLKLIEEKEGEKNEK